MLYDLNVPWTERTSDLQRTLTFLDELGYNVVALNHSLTGTLPAKLSNPIPAPLPFALPRAHGRAMTVLRRATLTLTDPSQNHRLGALAAAYDVVAVRPTTEKAFLAACLNLTDASLISLDLGMRFPFHFRPKPLMTAVKRGLRVEICYAQALGSAADPNTRRNFIGNVLAIVRATRGRGLVLSSEAKSVLGIRAPADVQNLMSVWGLPRERGVEAVDGNPRAVVLNEGLKRTSYRGVVVVVHDGAPDSTQEPTQEPAQVPTKGDKNQSAKRQHEQGGSEGKTSAPLSKRQAKKRRLEAMKEAVKAKSTVPDEADNHPLFAGFQK